MTRGDHPIQHGGRTAAPAARGRREQPEQREQRCRQRRQRSGRQRPQRQQRRSRRPAGLVLLLVVWLVACGSVPVWAQTRGAPLADLDFVVRNGTTGEPTGLDRLAIVYFTVASDKIVEVEPEGAEFTLPRVPIYPNRAYLVTA